MFNFKDFNTYRILFRSFHSLFNHLSGQAIGVDAHKKPDCNSVIKENGTANLVEMNGNLNVDQFKVYTYNGVKYIYVTPLNEDSALNILVDSIKTKNFNDTRIAIVCEHSVEAEKMLKQLGKRSVSGFLINKPHEMLSMGLSLWTEGLLNSVLILCDDMLPLPSECGAIKVNYLIHSTQPLPHVFQMRVQSLIEKSEHGIEVMIIETPVEAEGQQNQLSPSESLVVKDVVKNDLTDNQSITDHDSILIEILPIPSEFPTPVVKTYGYGYNNFNIFAFSQYKQIHCFNIRGVKNLDSETIETMKTMNIGYYRAKCVQRYAWPHVANRYSMCVVGHEMSGKTWCYLPWICQFINKQMQLRKHDECGPSCIILCANEKQGNQIATWCDELMSNPLRETNLIVKLFDLDRVAEIGCLLQSPCGILLTNAELLLELRQFQEELTTIFNPSSIRCLVIDNLDIMWRTSRLNSEDAVDWLLKILSFGCEETQLLITGRLWSQALMKCVLPRLPDMLLLFEDALEATVYGGVKLDLIYDASQQYEPHIVKLLQEKKEKKQRVIVACQSKEDVLNLHKVLSSANIDSIVRNNANQTRALKDFYAGKVLLVFDDALPKIQGEKIDCLVHYTTGTSWQRFKERFRVFYGTYETQHIPECSSIVFIRNVDQIWYMCDFLYKHDIVPPSNWISTLNSHRIENEKLTLRSDEPLCRQLLNYGHCCRRSCSYRHIMWDFEAEESAHPKEGEIKFVVLFTNSPSQLAVKLSQHVIVNHFFKAPITKLGKSIQDHYMHLKTKLKHENPKRGDLCIVRLKDQYQRVLVTRIISENRVEIKQLDAGVDFQYVRLSELLHCEKQFEDGMFEAVELRLTGLMPSNMERIWSEDIKRFVRNNFFKQLYSKNTDRIFTAKVDFTFHDAIFIDNVYDENGKDLKDFLRENKIQMNLDKDVQKRFNEILANAIPPVA